MVSLGLTALIVVYRNRIDKRVLLITGIYTVLLFMNLTVGITNYGLDERVFENLLMQSFILAFPLYSIFIKTKKDVKLVIRLFKYAALIMAVGYLLLIVAILLGFINFLDLLLFLSNKPEFLGRGTFGFFYKGFIYMCGGFFFLSTLESKSGSRIKEVLVIIAIILTFMRGFLLAMFAAFLIYYFFFVNKLRAILLMTLGAFALTFYIVAVNTQVEGRDKSDSVRYVQIEEVFEEVDIVSFFIGHGFGEGVPVRPNHLEINFLEIFHKQGIFALLFWASLLYYVISLYRRLRNTKNEWMARPFFLVTLFLYIQSMTNPFLTNSMGMNILFISIIVMQVLDSANKE